jgi:hypothetical protein
MAGSDLAQATVFASDVAAEVEHASRSDCSPLRARAPDTPCP